MKKITFIIILAVIIIIGLFPISKQVPVQINASYLNSYQQLMNTANWYKWLGDAPQNDSSLYKLSAISNGAELAGPGVTFLIAQQGSNALMIKKENGTNRIDYSYIIIPGKSGVLTTVMVNLKTNLFKSLMPGYEDKVLNETGIYNFRRFMEDVKQFYGFKITKQPFNDKNILVKKTTIVNKQLYSAIAAMQKQLLAYVAYNQLKQTSPMMMQYNKKSGDSVQVLMGIPVNKLIIADHGIQNMHIPETQVLAADFKGRYTNKQKIYTAMGRYVQDKFLHTKIAPLEIFPGKLPQNKSDSVNFTLIYPIF